MQKIIFTLVALLVMLYVGCTETRNNFEKLDNNYHEPLAGFLSTRASDPLDETVWMAVSTDEFRRMLLFKDGDVNLFYGLIENGEMQRWSEYYSAPYELSKDATTVTTKIIYPIFGEKEMTEMLTVVKTGDNFTLRTELDTYEYVGGYTHDLDDRWTLVHTTIQPWGE